LTFGEAIKEARRVLAISQKDLAAAIIKEDGEPISPQYLNDIERDRRIPSSHVIAQLGKKLKVDPDYLHVLAERFPADLRANRYEPTTVQAALKAFRKRLNG